MPRKNAAETEPVEKEHVPRKDPKERLVLVNKKIDAGNVYRTREPLTPGHCSFCGKNIASAAGLPAFEKLDEIQQARVKEAVAKHKEIAHTRNEKLIVRREELEDNLKGLSD